ncbi:MAG: hypothetical protein A2W91_03525 [Bacteroidetes bacterium GWF2_38_335]|nr:MAG: hypothetical protein A2W91_03525 [Bacteroidetes bacterium GWF2_38_335]OFY77446.1 MAG: hypothetical protein A2281_01235 [Bacteroidetes bacterium RIFOXYA12_FULL_38_20]
MLLSAIFALGLLFSCNSKSDSENNSTVADSTASIQELTELIREEPRNASLYGLRSDLFIKQGNIDFAIKDLEIAIGLDSLEPSYYLKLSEYYLRNQGKSLQAKETLEKCIRIFPKNVDALLGLANIYFYVQEYTKSEEFLTKVKEIDQHNPHIYFTSGLIFLEKGDTAGAVKNFRTTLEKEPKYYKAHMELGRLFSVAKDSIALQYFKNAIDLAPESVEAYYHMGMYYQNMKNWNKAIDAYTNILTKIDSTYPDAHHNIGYVYLEQKQYKQAVDEFSKAIKFDTAYIEAYLHRGVCYMNMRDKGKAKRDFDKCLLLQPNYPYAINALNALDKK